MFRNMTPETQKRLFLVLVIIGIACLGALPVGSLLFARLHISTAQTSATTPATTYTEGECTSSSTHVIYMPAPQTSPVPDPLPPAWQQANRNGQDYTNALACAATFVETYESFDYHQVQSLYAAMPLLSSQARQRFYQGNGASSANARTDAAWQKKIQRDRIIQVARVSLPTPVASTYSEGSLYVTLLVPYQTIEQIDGQTSIQNHFETVLLRGVPADRAKDGTGWQIADWRENK